MMELVKSVEFQHIVQAIQQNAKARNTQKAYKRDIEQFEYITGQKSYPVDPDLLKGYFFQLASQKYKFSSIARKAASLDYAHKSRNIESPFKSEEMKTFMAGLKRTMMQNNPGSVISKQAPAIMKKDFARVCETLYLQDTRKSLRDRLMIIMGYVGALRVSEIRNIRVKDLQKIESGYILHITESKNLKVGETGKKFLPYSSNIATCPVRTFEKYIEILCKDEESFLFHGFRRGDHEDSKQITVRAIQYLVTDLFGEIYSAHSLRAGFVTQSFENGSSASQIMIQTGHRSLTSLLIYDRSDLLKRNAVTGIV